MKKPEAHRLFEE